MPTTQHDLKKRNNKKACSRILKQTFCAIALTLTALPASAQDKQGRYELRIGGGTVAQVVEEVHAQTGYEFVYSFDLVDVDGVKPVRGVHTLQEALDLMFEGTGLSGGLTESGMIVITREDGAEAPNREAELNSDTIKKGLMASISAVVFGSGAATGQVVDGGDADALSAERQLDTVIVTATKREASSQDIPGSIAAIGGEEISRRELVSMSDYLRTTPGVNQIDRGVGRNAVIIRGVASAPQTEGNAVGPTVGIYLGDIPLTGQSLSGDSADIKLVDIERVEILRGPQGSLYGDSSLGGTVRSIPVAPNTEATEGWVKAGASITGEEGGENYNIQGAFNLPLVEDKLALRIVGYQFDDSGYVNNIAGSDPAFSGFAGFFGIPELAVDQDQVGGSTYTGARAALRWTPTPEFDATLTYLWQNLEQDGFPDVQLNLAGDYQQTRLRLGEVVGGGNERLEDEIEILNLVMEYDLGWGSILSSTSLANQESLQNRDIGSFFGIPAPQTGGGDSEVFVEELRLVSDFEGPFQFVGGVYYQNIDRVITEESHYGGVPALNPLGASTLILDRVTNFEVEQLALFGEASYDLTDALTLTGGFRLFNYERNDDDTSMGAFATPPTDLSSDETDSTFKANLSYKLDEDSLVYAQFSQGFRLGRTVAPPPASLCDLDNDGLLDDENVPINTTSIDSDNLDSYEVGGKFLLANGSVSINASAYHNQWEGIPVTVLGTCGFGVVLNAGEARTQGFELESAAYLTDNLLVGLGASYVDAELTADAEGLGSDGDRLPGSPEFTFNANAQYEFMIGSRDSFVRADYAYVGGFYNNLQETGTEAGDYHQLNAKLGIRFDAVDFELFAQNLTNSSELTWVGTVFANADARAFRQRPRTVGVSARYAF